jgi:hypothetical protein
MATAGSLHIDLSASSAKFDADLNSARRSLGRFGGDMKSFGAIAGTAGQKLSAGLKRGVGDLTEIGNALGVAGGQAARFSGQLADLVLGGFNPISLAVAGLGFVIGQFTAKTEDSFKEKVPTAVEESRRAVESLVSDISSLDHQLRGLTTGRSDTQLQIEDQETHLKGMADQVRERAEWAAEYWRILGNIKELKSLGYEEDSRAVKRQQHLLEIATAQWRVFEQQIEPEERKLKLLNDRLRLEEKITAERKRQAAAEDDAEADERARDAANAAGLARQNLARAIEDEAQKSRRESAQAEWDAELDRGQAAGNLWKAIAAEQEKSNAAEKAFFERMPGIRAELAGIGEGMDLGRVAKATPAVRGFTEELRLMQAEMQLTDQLGVSLAHTLTEGVAGGIGATLTDITMGSKDAKEAFKDFAQATVSNLLQMTLSALAFRAIMSGIGFGVGGAAPGAIGPTGAAAAVGGVKSAMVSAPRVTVYNTAAGAEVSAASTTGADGMPELEIFVEEIAAKSVLRGGKLSQALRDVHGLQRSPRRRS